MAHFDRHCRDCELILGKRHEDVNRWLDELMRQYGIMHRRYRHHWGGVREVQARFGDEGAKAAIVHIVRDCGAVHRERDYGHGVDDFGTAYEPGEGLIVRPPEMLMYDGEEKAVDKFRRAVEDEFRKFLGK